MASGRCIEEKQVNAEWRFLARRVLMLCQSIDQVSDEGGGDRSDARESSLQDQAFRERRDRALDLMERIREGVDPPGRHLEDLRRIVSGLECSQTFFVSRRRTA